MLSCAPLCDVTNRPISASPLRATVAEPTWVQVCPSVEAKLVIVLPVRVSLSQALGGAVAGPAALR